MKPFAGSDPSTLSTSLLYRIQDLQPDAWERLVESFSPIIYGWCRASGLNGTDSADIVQEVFSSVIGGIGRFTRKQESGSFRAWLATITRNQIRDWMRKKHRTETAKGGSEFLKQLNSLPDQGDQSVSETTLNRALPKQILNLVKNEIEPNTWAAFWRVTFDDCPADVVAIEMKMSVASVYQAKSRVLRRIRQRLAELP